MRLRFLETFDGIPDLAAAGWVRWGSWDYNNLFVAGRTGKGIHSGGGQGSGILLDSQSTLVLGLALKRIDVGQAIRFQDSSGLLENSDYSLTQVYFQITDDGALNVKNGDGTVLASLPAGSIPGNAYTYIELGATFHATQGWVGVRINNQLAVDINNVNTIRTANASAKLVQINGPAAGSGSDLDDLYIADGNGTDFTGPFWGDHKLYVDLPNGDGTYKEFTPSSGTTHYNLVDEDPFNGTDYVTANGSGVRDSYLYPAFSATNRIDLVALLPYLQASVLNARALVRHGGADGVSEQINPPGTYARRQVYMFRNPANNALWTAEQVNNAELGLRAE